MVMMNELRPALSIAHGSWTLADYRQRPFWRSLNPTVCTTLGEPLAVQIILCIILCAFRHTKCHWDLGPCHLDQVVAPLPSA